MELHQSIELIPGLLNFTYIRNMGVAFGIFAEFNAAITLSIISSLAIIFLLYLFYKTENHQTLELTAISMIIGGAAGNLIDRIQKKGVIDFIDFYYNNKHWPAFNLADSVITIGMFLYVYSVFFQQERE